MGQSWTFTRKLAVGFGTMVALVIVMGAIALNALNNVSVQLDSVTTAQMPEVVEALRMETASESEFASFRGYLLTGDQKSLETNAATREDFARGLERLRSSSLMSGEERAALDRVSSASAAYARAEDSVLDARKAGKEPAALEATIEAQTVPLARQLRAEIDVYLKTKLDIVSGQSAAATSAARRSLMVVLGVALSIVAFCVAIAIVLTRGLSRQIGVAVHQIESSSAELQSAANQQSAGIKEQSTALTEITTTLNELLSTSRQIAESAQSVARIAGETSQASASGDQGMADSTAAIGGIREEVDRIVEHMLELGKKSREIGGIVDLINELSEQTNILAINATIEAAGAGEHGLRFGAVAEEIRKLATRVGNATKEIRQLVEQVRSAVSSTVMATETGSKTVDAGQARFKGVAEQFGRIGALVETTTEAAREIELSTKQQSTAVEQVNAAIISVSQASKETAASASQTLQTARELVTLSGDLARIVTAQERA